MRKLSFLVLATVISLAACSDETGPDNWSAAPDTATIFSLEEPAFQGLPGAFDFYTLRPRVVEQPSATGQWDVALTGLGDTLFITPAGAFPEISSSAGVAVIEAESLEEVRRAPRGDGFITDRSVPLRTDRVYVVRSRVVPVGLGLTCVRYAKFRPVELDEEAGTLRFEYARNPNCFDRDLIPPNDD